MGDTSFPSVHNPDNKQLSQVKEVFLYFCFHLPLHHHSPIRLVIGQRHKSQLIAISPLSLKAFQWTLQK